MLVVLGLFVGAALIAQSAQARDLTLAEAETLLARNNRELQAARRVIESADAQRMIAGARPNATFSINSTAIASNVKPDTVFRIDQPFERGNKRELRLDAASGLQRAAPVAMVKSDHHTTATVRLIRTPMRSTTQPAGICMKA